MNARTPIHTITPPAMGRSQAHESARAQVTGSAPYVDDIPELKGTLHAAPILSTVAHGHLRGIDASAALAMPGVRGVVLHGRYLDRGNLDGMLTDAQEKAFVDLIAAVAEGKEPADPAAELRRHARRRCGLIDRMEIRSRR